MDSLSLLIFMMALSSAIVPLSSFIRFCSLKNIYAIYLLVPFFFGFCLPALFINQIDILDRLSFSYYFVYEFIFVCFIFIFFYCIGFSFYNKKSFNFPGFTFRKNNLKFLKVFFSLLLLFFILTVSENPFTDKYGVSEQYENSKVLYRLTSFLIIFFIPLFLLSSSKIIRLFYFLIILFMLFITQKKGFYGNPLILFFLFFYIFSQRGRLGNFFLLPGYIFLFVFAISLNIVFSGKEFNFYNFLQSYPHLKDNLLFLMNYEIKNNIYDSSSFIIGSFFPFIESSNNFASYSKLILFDDLNIAHGGIVYSLPIFIYVFFKLPGLVVFSILYGMTTSYITNLLKFLIKYRRPKDLQNLKYSILLLIILITLFRNFPIWSVDKTLLLFLFLALFKKTYEKNTN